MRSARYSVAILACSAGLISLLVFLRALGCDFVGYDDPDYVLVNPLIRHLDYHMIVSAVTEPYNGWWMPLTWISLAIDYHFWQLNPTGYHFTNIILHAFNTGFVVLITEQIWSRIREPGDGQKRYLQAGVLLLAGLLWGIHPLRVESVAWVTERKDVLNGLFSLGAVLMYLRYLNSRMSGNVSSVCYLFSLLLFACSLMSKSVSVVLPMFLLVLDWYPFQRIHKGTVVSVLIEKVPFLLLSAGMAVLTMRFSAQAGYLVPYSVFPFAQRLLVSGNAIVEYFRMMLWPVNILPFYLIPDPIPASYALTAIASAVAMLGCWCFYRRHPWLPAALSCFLLPLLPVLAFFQNGDQSHAARFTYLPAVAPSIAAAILTGAIYRRSMQVGMRRWVYMACIVFAVVFCVGTTVRDISVWKNAESFWTRVIDISPEVASFKARGRLYAARGDYQAAIADYTSAISLASGVWQRTVYNLYAFRGEAYLSSGHYNEAVQDFTTALSLYPHPLYYYLRGRALQQLGDSAAAARDFVLAGNATGPLEWFERVAP